MEGVVVLIFLVIQLNGEGQREEVPWNWRRRQKKTDKKVEKTVGMDGQSN